MATRLTAGNYRRFYWQVSGSACWEFVGKPIGFWVKRIRHPELEEFYMVNIVLFWILSIYVAYQRK